MPKKTFKQAINEALHQEMRRDPTVIVIGEDVAGGNGAPGEQGPGRRRVRHHQGAVRRVRRPSA